MRISIATTGCRPGRLLRVLALTCLLGATGCAVRINRMSAEVAATGSSAPVSSPTSASLPSCSGTITPTQGMAATVVVGQPTMTATSANQGGSASANTLNGPDGVTVLSTGGLVIGEFFNHRYLFFNTIPTSNNAAADLVWGQPDASTTTSNTGGISGSRMATGRNAAWNGSQFFLADSLNSRVLVFNSIPTSASQAADYIVGQPNSTSDIPNNGGLNEFGLNAFYGGIFADSTRLVVSDASNSRVLIYPLPITSNTPGATVAVGQADMNSAVWGGGGSTSASSLTEAAHAIIAAGKLIIADRWANRVLIFNTVPTASGASADVVIGQANFTDSGSGSTATQLNGPHAVSVDPSGRLYIADAENNRVLVYNSIPTSNGAAADLAIGQPDLTSVAVNQGGAASATTLNRPTFVDATRCKLVIEDQNNNRVLIY